MFHRDGHLPERRSGPHGFTSSGRALHGQVDLPFPPTLFLDRNRDERGGLGRTNICEHWTTLRDSCGENLKGPIWLADVRPLPSPGTLTSPLAGPNWEARTEYPLISRQEYAKECVRSVTGERQAHSQQAGSADHPAACSPLPYLPGRTKRKAEINSSLMRPL